MKNKAFLLLSGEPPKTFPDLSDYAIICATDAAFLTLQKHNIIPDFIAGDFDSLKLLPEEVEKIHTPNQNYTDFYKILEILSSKGIKEVDVFGASGKEQDHFLDHLSTAISWKNQLKLTFYDSYGYYFLADQQTKIDTTKNNIVSLIPFPEATKIKTKGLEYSLNFEDLKFGKRLGTRNRAVNDTIEITFESGNLFLFIINQQNE